MTFRLNPLLASDGYKTGHHIMYTPGTTKVHSNYTCRSIKYMPKGAEDVIVSGVQYTFKYIQELWKENFFDLPKEQVCDEAKFYLSNYLMSEYDVRHFEALHDIGYLPIEVKSLKEGTKISAGIPLFTIENTKPEQFWLTNFLETLISTLIWKPVHSASLAYAYRKVLEKYALETDKDNLWFVDFQAHDFSFRGMQAPEAAISSGLGFATIFKGSDTIPVLKATTHYYGDTDSIYSVNATEHSVMCSGSKEGEIETFRRLMKSFPKGILSVVSDTWDLWKVLTEYLPELKEEILARDGKLVIRPDSGDPVDIICGKEIQKVNSVFIATGRLEDLVYSIGDELTAGECGGSEYSDLFEIEGIVYKITVYPNWNRHDKTYYFVDGFDKAKVENVLLNAPDKGLVELLWETFGGTVNEQGYKVLDSHIGAIYGDSITLERAEQICARLKAKGFASTNIVLGVGSYSMGYSTRDNQGGAVKSTYVEINGEGVEIFKDPVTDDGTKKSAKGLLQVYSKDGIIKVKDCCTREEAAQGLLKTIFKDGKFYNLTTLNEIREFIKLQ